jgi:hypothetical protein
MRRAVLVSAGAMLLTLGAADAHARHYRHHRRHHPHVFFGGSFVWNPFFHPYPYPYPWPPPYPVYAYPPPPLPPEAEADAETERDARRATYGLVQLRGVPDGAEVALDERFWLTAEALDQRWLAVPEGEHSLAVRVDDRQPVKRRIEITAGRSHVVHFTGLRPPAG